MELGEALRNTENSLADLTPLSSGAYSATSFQRKEAKICAVRRHHNPQPEGLSNLRTLRPAGPVNLKNLSRSKDAELTFQ